MARHNRSATTCTVARARGSSFHVTRGEKNLLWKFVRDSLTSQSNGATSRPAMLVRIVLPYASARAEAPLLLLVCVCVRARARVRACGGGGLCYSQELSSGGADALRSFAFAAIAATRGCALWLPRGTPRRCFPFARAAAAWRRSEDSMGMNGLTIDWREAAICVGSARSGGVQVQGGARAALFARDNVRMPLARALHVRMRVRAWTLP